MSKPSAEQIQKLEIAHKVLFVDLVLANKLFISLLPKIKGKKPDSKEYKAIDAFGRKIIALVTKWYMRQKDYETKAGIPKSDPDILKYFLQPKNQDKLIAQAKKFVNPAKYDPLLNPNPIKGIFGIGFIPLLIWAVIAIAAAYTVTRVTDDFTTTSEEKADLLKQTQATLKDLGVTGQQAANIITETQHDVSQPTGESSFGGLFKILPWAVGGYFVMQYMGKNKTTAN